MTLPESTLGLCQLALPMTAIPASIRYGIQPSFCNYRAATTVLSFSLLRHVVISFRMLCSNEATCKRLLLLDVFPWGVLQLPCPVLKQPFYDLGLNASALPCLKVATCSRSQGWMQLPCPALSRSRHWPLQLWLNAAVVLLNVMQLQPSSPTQ